MAQESSGSSRSKKDRNPERQGKRRGEKREGDDKEKKERMQAEQRERERLEKEKEEQRRLQEELEEKERLAREEAAAKAEAAAREAKEAEDLKKAEEAAKVKKGLREANLNAQPDAAALKNLDSSIKKNTAMIKKLRQLSEETGNSVCEDLRKVNMSMYVSEAAAAITEAKLKLSDVDAAVRVCSVLHQRYQAFSGPLLQGLMKVGVDLEESASRRRACLRLLTELMVVGVLNTPVTLTTILKDIAGVSSKGCKEKSKDQALSALNLLAHFAKHAQQELLYTPQPADQPTSTTTTQQEETLQGSSGAVQAQSQQTGNQEGGAEGGGETLTSSTPPTAPDPGALVCFFLPPEEQKPFRTILQGAYDSSLAFLLEEHTHLQRLEQSNARALQARGELSEDASAGYEAARKVYESLWRALCSLAQPLGLPPPSLPQDPTTRMGAGSVGGPQLLLGSLSGPADGTSKDLEVWEDEEARAFYVDIPDLKVLVPAVLLGGPDPGASEVEAAAGSGSDNVGESGSGESQQAEVSGAAPPPSDLPAAPAEPSTEKEGGDQKEGRSKPEATDGKEDKEDQRDREGDKKPAGESDKESSRAKEGAASCSEDASGSVGGLGSAGLEALLARLPLCGNRDLADKFSLDFCYLNSKGTRRKLVKALFAAPRTSLEILPYYARIVGTLSRQIREVGPALVALLEEDLQFLMHKKDPRNLESKIRDCRYMGELAKFKVMPASVVFTTLKNCLDDFSGHNVDVACHLLESCGRFLYRSPETSVRAGALLDIFWRLKKAKNLDPNQTTMVENAYYSCRPPERPALQAKQRPPLHHYIRHLLFAKLTKSTLEHVLKQCRRLPWPECEGYIIRCLLKVCKARYGQLPLAASLASGLGRYHPSLSVGLVDCLMEEIRVGLESAGVVSTSTALTQASSTLGAQRRVAQMRFFGELYNYRIIQSREVFEMLYLLLSFGHSEEEEEANEIWDPPYDYFRVRLVVCLLETCGTYFDRGSSKKKLDVFLLYFQRYLLSKASPLPVDVEFDVEDLLQLLRPQGLTRFSTFEAAHAECLKIEQAERGSERGSNAVGSESEEEAEGEGSDTDPEEDAEQEDEEAGVMEPGTGREDRPVEEEEEDEDDEVKLLTSQQTEEDEEEAALFEKEFQSMMQESVGQAKLARAPQLNMPAPAASGIAGILAPSSSSASTSSVHPTNPLGGNDVAFRFLVKKGGKQQTKQVQLPADSPLAFCSLKKEEEEKEERNELKRLVLDYHARGDADVPPSHIKAIHQPAVPPSKVRASDSSTIYGANYGLVSRGPAAGKSRRRR